MSDTRAQTTSSIVGDVLGNYRVISELSRGGMGTVYRAEHALLGRPAAIKLLHSELTRSDELVQRFFNEAKAATAIRHPGIVEVYDFGYADDGRAYLVMEFLEGEPLGARLARRGRLPEPEAAHIARGIAGALRAAHGKGIFHRDLKPDNVFLVPDPDGAGDRVKVLDFGVAKLADATPEGMKFTRTGALMGTPLYMAPEQARAAATIDHRADLYSLGCILYELLVGEPPFVAEGAGEIIALQMFGTVEPPRQRVAELTAGIETIVMRLLEKEPDARYASAHEVQQALARILERKPTRSAEPAKLGHAPTQVAIVAAAAPPATHVTEPPRSRRAMPVIAGAIALVLVAGAGALLAMRGDGSRATPPIVAPSTGPTATPTTAPPPVAAPSAPAPEPARGEPPDVPDVPDVIVEESGDPAPAPRRRRLPPPAPRRDQASEATTEYRAGTVTKRGLVTDKGSPIEVDLDPSPTAGQRPLETP